MFDIGGFLNDIPLLGGTIKGTNGLLDKFFENANKFQDGFGNIFEGAGEGLGKLLEKGGNALGDGLGNLKDLLNPTYIIIIGIVILAILLLK